MYHEDIKSVIKSSLDSYDRITLSYHWDADGMLSAITLVSYYGEADRVLLEPPRFTFNITNEYVNRLEKAVKDSNALVIVDLAYPNSAVSKIARRISKPIIIIDHHTNDDPPKGSNVIYYNPAVRGDPEGLYPSALHVLVSILGVYHPLLVAASIVGDLGPRAKSNKIYQNYMVEAGLDPVREYHLVKEAVDLLDSLNILGNYDGIRWIPKVVGIGDMDPFKAILNDALLATLKVNAEAELEQLFEEAREALEEPADGIKAVLLEGSGRHASRLTRKLAEEYKDYIVIVGYHAKSTGEARVYARTLRQDVALASLIPVFRGMGYSAGGKMQAQNNVFSVETTPDKLGQTYKLVIDHVIKLVNSKKL